MNVPADSLACGIDQFMRLTFSQMNTQNNVYNVSASNNVISIAGTAYSIDPGFYTMGTLATTVNSLQNQLSVSYQARANKFVFNKISLAASVTISFQGRLRQVFGCDASLIVTSTVTAPYCALPNPVTDFVIRIKDVLLDPPTNLYTTRGGDLNSANIFAVVPLRARPGCQNVFYNLNNSYTIDVFDTDIQNMSLFITDSDGNEIQGLSHWTAVIKCERLDRPSLNPKLAQLTAIAEYSRLQFMQTALRDGRNDQYENKLLYRQSRFIDNA
jgi:hypothetical protein